MSSEVSRRAQVGGEVQVPISKTPSRKRLAEKYRGWAFITPGLIFHILAVTVPAGMSLYLPFTDWNGLNTPKFIGLRNFAEAFHDPVVGRAFLNNLEWAGFWITIPMIFSFILAYLLRKVRRGQTMYQAMYFSTSIMTVTVAGQIWLWIYDPFSGVNFYLDKWGLKFLEWPGLTVLSLALLSVLFADMWRGFGGNVIWLLAAMTQMDKSIEEAAMIDGAGRLKILLHVVLPQLRPTLVILFLLTILGSFGAFETVYVMTGGGPAHTTETLSTYYYSLSVTARRAGYASSLAIFHMMIAMVLIVVYAVLRKRKGWEV
ncbi:MAG: sugar ABC transporter permease [Alicyclobacillus sp.]|nr:sugar ABC transporter permease [Alicyclobacillus sp.]